MTAPRLALFCAVMWKPWGLAASRKFSAATRASSGDAPSGPPYTLAFLDPPYGKALAEIGADSSCRRRLAGAEALVIVEEAAAVEFSKPEAFEKLERRDYGETQVVFLRYRGDKRT